MHLGEWRIGGMKVAEIDKQKKNASVGQSARTSDREGGRMY